MPADVTISSQSTEYVQVPIQATIAGLPANPSGDAVALSFVPAGVNAPGTFNPGSWDVTAQGIFLAQCLVGPGAGGVVLAPGTYQVWVRVTDNPEVPIKPAGTLTIT